MEPDIKSRADIEIFIGRFYEKVRVDPVIGYIFNNIVEMDWDNHIPVIVDFWETILLDNPIYKKNAMAVHYELAKKILLETAQALEGLNRHASTNAAGVVISDRPLKKRIPLFKTADDQITTGLSMNSPSFITAPEVKL